MKMNTGTSLTMAVLLAAGVTVPALGNDECSTAVALVDDIPTSFDTTTATPSADPAPDDTQCAGSFLDWGTNNPDVWFSFTPSENGRANFTTCTGAGALDTSMVLYTGTCGALTQVACNGDASPNTSCQAFYSAINDFEVVGGTTYFIRIGGWNGDTGAANITVNFIGASEVCGNATGDCGEAHGGQGCNDPVCCAAVCAVNPLCCDLSWDQSCVETAITECGIFIYQCLASAYPNDCATNATVFAGDTVFANVANAGANTDGPDHAATTCASGNDFFFNDRWYRVQAQANGSMRVNTCNAATYDTKLAVYNMGADPAAFNFNTLPDALVGCNDDGSTECQGSAAFTSDLSVNVQAGNWYLVRLATYDNPGTATMTVDMPEPCQLDTATGNENEPCGEDTNGGCNSTIPATTPISPGQTIAGNFWANGGTRDTDWYGLSVGSDQSVTVTVKSGQFNRLLVLSGACESLGTVASVAGSCGTTTTACLSSGNYFLFVAATDAAGNAVFEGLPCGSGILNNYTISVTATPSSCPVVIAPGACANPGPDTATINSAETIATGIVRCAAQPAFPACATGYSTDNSYARTFAAGTVGGQIQCVRLGLYSVRRGTNAAGTACGLFLSDLPLPATVGIYRDTDGGAPRIRGEGGDLVAIDSRLVLMAGQAAVSPVNYDPPVCIEDFAGQNIVVVVDFPSTQFGDNGIPANAGYQMLVAGNNLDAGSQTYCKLGPCDANPEFKLTEQIGATFVSRWVVAINGDFSGCSSGNCPTDIDGDGVTGASDLSTLLNGWGTASPDLDGDGTVGASDLSTLLNGWGACP
jgi:hypothetical protein